MVGGIGNICCNPEILGVTTKLSVIDWRTNHTKIFILRIIIPRTNHNIKIGSAVGDVDLSGYTLSSRYEERENTYHFEELHITTDETGAIVYIQGNFHGQNIISLSVNQADEFETIENATAILG